MMNKTKISSRIRATVKEKLVTVLVITLQIKRLKANRNSK